MAYKDVDVNITVSPLISYTDISDKPSLNGKTIEGQLTSEDVGLQPAGDYASQLDLENTNTRVEANSNDLTNIKADIVDINTSVEGLNTEINLKANTADIYTKIQVDDKLSEKQDKLTAGTNITISSDNVISATGGGGGSSDYADLTNKPLINNVELIGNKTLTDLGIASKTDVSNVADDLATVTNQVDAQGQSINDLNASVTTLSNTKFDHANLLGGKDIEINEILPDGGIDDRTLACFHFDGNYLDSSLNPLPKTGIDGVFNSDIKKFGSASLQVVSMNNTSGNISYNPTGSEFNFLNGDWTIDFWYYQTSQMNKVLLRLTSPFTMDIGFYPTPKLEVASTFTLSSPNNTKNNEWVHYAFVRNGNDFYIFENGIKTATTNSTVVMNNSTVFNIMCEISSSVIHYIDELRISKGIARWTEDFTPPTVEYTEAKPTGKYQIDYVGGGYNLPISSTTTLGGVKVDGTSITVTSDGTISTVGGSGTSAVESVNGKTGAVVIGTDDIAVTENRPNGDIAPSGYTLTNYISEANSTFGSGGGSTPANMVTTDTEQTINGIKTFSNNIIISNGNGGAVKSFGNWNIIELNQTTGIHVGQTGFKTTIYSTTQPQAVIGGEAETNILTSSEITKIKKLTQSEYDALSTKDESTFYVIVG